MLYMTEGQRAPCAQFGEFLKSCEKFVLKIDLIYEERDFIVDGNSDFCELFKAT